MTDVTKLSDQELLEIINAGGQVQPVDATTGEPLNSAQSQTYRQLGAAGGIDPGAEPGSPRLPLAQRRPEDTPQAGQFYVDTQGKVRQQPEEAGGIRGWISERAPFLGHSLGAFDGQALRAFSTSVPVLGAFADEANAATNATLAPTVEPLLRALEAHGIDTPYDERMRLDNGGNWAERYAAALDLEKLQNEAARNYRPDASVAGMLAGGLATLPYLPSVGLGAEAGMLGRIGVGAAEGSGLGAVQGYGEGAGGVGDPSRIAGAGQGGAVGGAIGAVAPVGMRLAGSAWERTGAKALDAIRSKGAEAALAARPDVQALARLTGGETGTPAALAQGPDRELADILASINAAGKAPDVSPSALDDAYARIARAAQRQGQTPEQLAEAVRSYGPRGVIADTGQAMRDLTRAAMNRPSGAEDIARTNLNIRQRGVRDGADFLARPASQRIADEAAAGLGASERSYFENLDALTKIQKEAADPLYEQVRAIGATNSPRLEALMNRPSMRKAVGQAYRIAKEEGREPEALALVSVESPDNWVSSLPDTERRLMEAHGAVMKRGPAKAPSQGKSLAKFIADGGGILDDGGDVAAMGGAEWNKGKPYQRSLIAKGKDAQVPLPGQTTPYQPGGQGADEWAQRAWEAGYFPQWRDRPTSRELFDAIGEELRGKPRYSRDASQELTDRLARRDQAEEMIYRGGDEPPPSPEDYVGRPTPTDELAYEAQPTAETWDYIKRALDDQLTPYREGKKAWDEEGRAVQRTLQELRGELVNLNPVYGEALNAYSGPASMKDALEAGRRAFQEDGDGLARKFSDFSAGEREMYRAGALQALRKTLGTADVTHNAAQRAGLLKPTQLERFKELFPSEAALRSFMAKLDAEEAMFGTRSDLFRVSTTAKQLANAMEAAPEPGLAEGLAETAINVKTGGALGMLRALRSWGSPQMSPETAEAIAAITTNLDQTQLPEVLRRMDQASSTDQLAQALKNYLRFNAATGGAAAATREPSQ